MKTKNILLILIAYGFCSCAVFHPQPLSPEQNQADFEKRSLADPGLKKFMEQALGKEMQAWPVLEWDYNLLSLAAFYYNSELDLARSQYQTSQAGVLTAKGLPNPDLELSNLEALLKFPLETAGKRKYRIDQAEHLSEFARLDIATAAWKARLELRAALLELYLGLEQAKLLNERISAMEQMVKYLDQRAELGELSAIEAGRFQIELDQMRLLQTDNQKQVDQSRLHLAAALGVPVSELRDAKINFGIFAETPREFDLADLRRQALLNRSDILSGLEQYQAGQSDLQLEIAKQYPNINLGPGYSWEGTVWMVGLSMELPLLNQNQGPIAQARARREQAGDQFNALQSKALREIDQAYAEYRAGKESLKLSDTIVQNYRRRFDSSRAAFSVGEIDGLELAQGRLELLAAQDARLESLRKWQNAITGLELAVQQDLSPGELALQAPELNPRKGKAGE